MVVCVSRYPRPILRCADHWWYGDRMRWQRGFVWMVAIRRIGQILLLLTVAGFLLSCGEDTHSAATQGDAGFHVENGFVHAPDGRVQILRGFNYANDHKFPDAVTGAFFPA